MGKKAKEHRKKVAARNARLKQQKSGMQKAFDMLFQEQLSKLKEDDLRAQLGDQELNMEVVQDRIIDNPFMFIPNEEESAKINKEFEEEIPTEE